MTLLERVLRAQRQTSQWDYDVSKIAELEADKQCLIEALEMSAEDAKDLAMQYVTEDNAPVNVKEFVSSKFEKLLSEMKKG
jgi:hypothetical protein